MDLRQIRYAIAVAEELNFKRAARRCHVSQPPLSRSIQALEDEIGARLFDRDKHHVAVTPAGEVFIAEARKALAMLQEASAHARRTAEGLSGTLKVGFGGSTAYALMPALMRHFREATPDVEITFRAMPVIHQIEALRSGDIDVGILRLPIFDELIETCFVHTEPLIVALPLGHPLLAQSGPIAVHALRSSPFVTYEPTRGFNVDADLHALCRLAEFEPMIAHRAPTTEAVIGIVACGEGVAIVPASAERLRMRGVAFRPLRPHARSPDLATVRFGLAWRKGQASATTTKFVEAVAAVVLADAQVSPASWCPRSGQ